MGMVSGALASAQGVPAVGAGRRDVARRQGLLSDNPAGAPGVQTGFSAGPNWRPRSPVAAAIYRGLGPKPVAADFDAGPLGAADRVLATGAVVRRSLPAGAAAK